MNSKQQQSGVFLLVALIFLMVIGSMFATAIIGLFSTSSLEQVAIHNGNVALAAARSGLQYAVYQREQQTGACVTPVTLASLTYPTSAGLAPTPCLVSVYESTPVLASTCTYTISSLASCDSNEAIPVTRRLAMRVRATDSPTSWDSYQAIPGSLVDVTISPNHGSTVSTTSVTIKGIGFVNTLTGSAGVFFGGTPGTNCCDGAGGAATDTQIKVTAPAHTAGTVDVVVATTLESITFSQAFTY